MDYKDPNNRLFSHERSNATPLRADYRQVINLSDLTYPAAGHDLTVQEAVDKYVALRLAEGLDPNGDTRRHLKKHLQMRLCAILGGVPLRSLTADHLRMWAATLKKDNGQAFEPLTVRHHIIDVKTFCKRAHGEGWMDRNPSLVVALPQIEETDVNIISLFDAFHFFKTNRDHRAIGRLSLEAFGGVRYTTAGKLTRENIKFPQRGIEMPSARHKSRKRKFRQGQPPNLWTWLAHAPEECWNLTLRQYADEKKEMHVSAGLRPMILKSEADRGRSDMLKNVWRHSFASYLLAKTKNYQPVSYLMQHTNAHTTEGYEGIATETDGRLYFAITPDTVRLSWDEFSAMIEAKAAH